MSPAKLQARTEPDHIEWLLYAVFGPLNYAASLPWQHSRLIA